MDSMNKFLSLVVIGVVALPTSCSSSKGDEQTGNAPPVYNPNGGATGNGLPAAQDTANGMLGITPTQASELTTGGCSEWTATPTGSGSAVMEFIIDVSGSMSSDPSDPNNPNSPTKWAVFSQTLPGVFAALPSSFAAGVLYYDAPNGQCYSADRADVGIAPLSQTQKDALTGSVSRAQTGGYTPTYQAWAQGLANITAWTPGPNDPPELATAGKYIVLITDGVPTEGRKTSATGTRCDTFGNGISQVEYDEEIGLIEKDGRAAGVKTFVVGVIGSNDPQGADYDPLFMLSKIAVAGQTTAPGCAPVSGTPTDNDVNPRGTYCHYDLSQSNNLGAALATALGGITSSVLSCNYAVPYPPPGQSIVPADTVLVFTDGATGAPSIVLQNTSATCDKGWHFTDYTNSQIEICGTTCATIQGNMASTMNLVFGCDTGTVIN
jgi:hypothetical protein